MAVVRLGCSVATHKEGEKDGKLERRRKRKQNGEKEDARRRGGTKRTWGIDTWGRRDGGSGGRSKVENGRERGTKGPAKGVTKRAGAEGDREQGLGGVDGELAGESDRCSPP